MFYCVSELVYTVTATDADTTTTILTYSIGKLKTVIITQICNTSGNVCQ